MLRAGLLAPPMLPSAAVSAADTTSAGDACAAPWYGDGDLPALPAPGTTVAGPASAAALLAVPATGGGVQQSFLLCGFNGPNLCPVCSDGAVSKK